MTEPTAEPVAPPTPEPEPETPEVMVPRELPAEVEPRSPADSALERAAEAALALPTLPGRDEFLALAMQARILSMSGAAPKAVQGNPHLAFHIAMVGRDLGISPSAALALVDVIETSKGPQLSLSPQLMNGQIARLGLGRILPVVRTGDRCVAVALEPGGRVDVRCRGSWPVHVEECRCAGVIGESEFTWRMAQEAGLAMTDCRPGAHSDRCRNRESKSWQKCNQGYQSYPERMLWWRAAGFAADDYFPEAGLGLYSPEELGAVVDDEGRPLDPASVSLPEGYAPKELPPEEKASDEDLADLRTRVAAFWPNLDARTAWWTLWQNTDGVEPLPAHIGDLLARQVKRAKAITKSIEDRIGRGEFGPAPQETGQEAQEEPQPAATSPDPAPPAESTPGPSDEKSPAVPENPEFDVDLDEEDVAAQAVTREANEHAWGINLREVRAELRQMGLVGEGEPDEVRNRLETALIRVALTAQTDAILASGSGAREEGAETGTEPTSLMDAYVETTATEVPSPPAADG